MRMRNVSRGEEGAARETNLEQATTEEGLVEENGVGDEGRLGELDVGVSGEESVSRRMEEGKEARRRTL